ncbi:MAG: alginate export family protein [Myxococcota bacterium]
MAVALIMMPTFPAYSQADDVVWKALTRGKVDFAMRYRFEYKDDHVANSRAKSSTLRTTLGYRTASLFGLGGYLQFEDITPIGSENYNDGGTNRRTKYATVVDPEGTEVNQAYAFFNGPKDIPVLQDTLLQYGRQSIEYDDQRFIGTVPWRQNLQTYDAFTLVNQSLPHTAFHYAYVHNVRRIFGEDNPTTNLSNFDVDKTHFLHLNYDGLTLGKISTFAYLINFENQGGFFPLSAATYGGRFTGGYDLTDQSRILYTLEGAHQIDYDDSTASIDSDYYKLVIGGRHQIGGLIEWVTAKVAYVVLEGDGGTDVFQMPFGTNHAFQGWSDKFLVTPKDGIEEIWLSLGTSIKGVKVTAIYHDFSSDHLDYDYGSELDLLIVRKVAKRYRFGVKISNYWDDRNTKNLTRNTRQLNNEFIFSFFAIAKWF